MTVLIQNVRYALRQLRRGPGFAAVAIVSLALGIGANAAIFSLFEQVLLRPLPVPEPNRLVNLVADGPRGGSVTCGQAGSCASVFSYPMFRDLESGQEPFAGIAAHRFFGANLATGEHTVPGGGVLVSGSYFPVLQLRPALGRLLGPDDDRDPGGEPVAVLSHRFWESRLGADPAVLGRTITVNGYPLTVVGVAPEGFDGVTLGQRADLFVPITMRGLLGAASPGFDDRRSYWAYLFARLKPGVSRQTAETAINRVYRPIVHEVEAPIQQFGSEQIQAQFLAMELALESGWQGQSTFHDDARLPLLLLFGVTGIVLLITCANIANLLLARGAGRAQELAVRASLGAGRARLAGQLVTESVVLAAIGGVASLLVAAWTLAFIAAFLPPETSAVLDLTLQPAALAWAAILALGTGLLFGAIPAIQATRPAAAGVLKASASRVSAGRGSARFRSSLVTAQIALSMALLVSAGLFVRSLLEITRVDLGLRIDNIVSFGVHPGLNGYDLESARVLFARVEEELAALPGVTAVTAARVPILRSDDWTNTVTVEGFERATEFNDAAAFNQVGPDYFRTLGIPLLSGREFSASDAGDPVRVAIINEAFALRFELDPRDAIGRRMAFGRDQSELPMEIVGVVRDASYANVKEVAPAMFFTPWRQHDARGLTFYVRTAQDPGSTLALVPGLIRRIDAELPVQNLTTLDRQLRDNIFLDRLIGGLTGAFAALATLLAAVGLFGVMAYTVAQRTREIGVRMALGADAGRIRRLVLRQVAWMLAVGGALGLVIALALGRAASSLLFGIEGHDAAAVVAGATLLVLVALTAGYLPARRATAVNPMIALREE
jgi:predicted permease